MLMQRDSRNSFNSEYTIKGITGIFPIIKTFGKLGNKQKTKYPNFPMMFSRGFFVWSAILVPSRCVRDEKYTNNQQKVHEK